MATMFYEDGVFKASASEIHTQMAISHSSVKVVANTASILTQYIEHIPLDKVFGLLEDGSWGGIAEMLRKHCKELGEYASTVILCGSGYAIDYPRPICNTPVPFPSRFARVTVGDSENYSHVYIMTDGEYLKIGISNDPCQRMKSIQTGNARKIRLLGISDKMSRKQAQEIESELHAKHSSVRQQGEWFNQEILDELKTTGMFKTY